MSEFYGNESIWQTQPPIDYIDTSLTINTWETVSADLSGGRPARLLYVIMEQTNNGAAVETVELEMTINGTAYTCTFTNAASGAQRYVSIYDDLSGGDFSFADTGSSYMVGSGFNNANVRAPFTATSIGLIRVRQTSAVDGVAAQIEVNITWDKLTRI